MSYQRDSWIIKDHTIIKALRHYGFGCWRDYPGSDWHRTNVPIAWNSRYRLPDGMVIESRGTQLVIEGTPEDPQPWIIEDWRVFSLLERNDMAAKALSPGWEYTWYRTACPIAFNGVYVFPCGHAISSEGTRLVFAGYRGKR